MLDLCAWLLKHDNLGRERAAPHQPSPALCEREFVWPIYCCWDEPHITRASFADLQDATEYELKLKRAMCAVTRIDFPAAHPNFNHSEPCFETAGLKIEQ